MGVEEKTAEEVYAFVSAKNLTPEELRASRLPNRNLIAVHVELTSKANIHYKIGHAPHRRTTGSSITLEGPYKNVPSTRVSQHRNDFKAVEEIIAEETGGKPKKGGHYDTMYTLSAPRHETYFPHKLTQEEIAGFVERYAQHFGKVRIRVASFGDISESTYRNSGLPAKKLSFELDAAKRARQERMKA